MRYARQLLAAIAASLWAPCAPAGDHLEPEWTPYLGVHMDGFDEILVSVFKEAYADDVRARLIVVPSFEPEYALGVKETKGTYRIFLLKPSTHLWYFPYREIVRRGQVQVLDENGSHPDDETQRRLNATLPDRPEDVPLSHCEIEIAKPVAETLIDIWRGMLVGTRFDEPMPEGVVVVTGDGTTYHFSMKINYDRLAGKTWSPGPSSPTGKLVAITDTMRDLCLTRKPALATRLAGQAETFRAALPPANGQ